MSISRKISILILGIVFVSMTLMTIFAYEYNANIIRKQIQYELKETSSSGGDKVDIMLEKETEKLLSIANKEIVRNIVNPAGPKMTPAQTEALNAEFES